jgi:hypothetical protein
MDYKKQYIKYKIKYLNFKKQYGGASNFEFNYRTELKKFCKELSTEYNDKDTDKTF